MKPGPLNLMDLVDDINQIDEVLDARTRKGWTYVDTLHFYIEHYGKDEVVCVRFRDCAREIFVPKERGNFSSKEDLLAALRIFVNAFDMVDKLSCDTEYRKGIMVVKSND